MRDLQPGARYRVREAFIDFDGRRVPAGEVRTFVSLDYFPYDGGYTLCFEEGVLRLAEIDPESSRVLASPGTYLERDRAP